MKSSLIALAAWTLSLPVYANHSPNHPADVAQPGAQQSTATLSEGEVRRVDKEARKITIRHGALANLDMPAMTMVFRVKDAGMLDQVKAGDKVRFAADKDSAGNLIVTKLEAQ